MVNPRAYFHTPDKECFSISKPAEIIRAIRFVRSTQSTDEEPRAAQLLELLLPAGRSTCTVTQPLRGRSWRPCSEPSALPSARVVQGGDGL